MLLSSKGPSRARCYNSKTSLHTALYYEHLLAINLCRSQGLPKDLELQQECSHNETKFTSLAKTLEKALSSLHHSQFKKVDCDGDENDDNIGNGDEQHFEGKYFCKETDCNSKMLSI